jgi:branched-chain amino acid transport system substrate-binding protein
MLKQNMETLRKWMMAVVASSLLTAPATSVAFAQGNDTPIKIGLLAPYSGVFATYGPKTIEAPVRLFLEQHGNKIAGRPVEVVIADDQSRPDVMVEKARELVENQKVDVIIGLVNSAGALAVRDYLDRTKALTMITVASARELTQSRKSDAIFRLSWANGQMEPAGAVFAEKLGLKSMAGIGGDYVASRQLLEILMENFRKIGGKTPMTLWSPLNTADFSSYLAQLKQVSDQVDAISPMLFGADGVRFFNQYREFGIKTPLYVFGDVTEQTTFLDQVGEAAVGTKAYWNYSPYLKNPANETFRTAYLKSFKRLPGAFSFHSFAAMQFFTKAAEMTKGNTKNFDAMKKALESITIDSPGGPLSFDKDHNVTHNVYLNEVKRGPDGIVAQIPMGPMIPSVGQGQTIEEARKALTDISQMKN